MTPYKTVYCKIMSSILSNMAVVAEGGLEGLELPQLSTKDKGRQIPSKIYVCV